LRKLLILKSETCFLARNVKYVFWFSCEFDNDCFKAENVGKEMPDSQSDTYDEKRPVETPVPLISFIIPAYNEEEWMPLSIGAIRNTMSSMGEPYEIIVANDASSDATASIAEELGAKVVAVSFRQIAATRNAGATQARGEFFFFIDADSMVSREVIDEALRHLRAGVAGGGCLPRYDDIPLWGRVAFWLAMALALMLRQPGGSCLFCTRNAFEKVGGFSEKLYVAEDAVFVNDLKRVGKFVMLTKGVITSARKLKTHSLWALLRLLARLVFGGPKAFKKHQGLEYWYDPAKGRPNARVPSTETSANQETGG
jgi:glycosyltransferase involved in cell wall biosynthesis